MSLRTVTDICAVPKPWGTYPIFEQHVKGESTRYLNCVIDYSKNSPRLESSPQSPARTAGPAPAARIPDPGSRRDSREPPPLPELGTRGRSSR
eukprot:759189-Hanusia_phi.AAC.7